MFPTPPWLQSILEEHFEEIQMLWELRRNAVRDPDYRAEDIFELDERIAANIDGLLINREHSEKILLAGLVSGDLSAVFAATFVILYFDDGKLNEQLVNFLCDIEDDVTIDGIAEALAVGPTRKIEPKLRDLLAHGRPQVASVAAEALAFHGKLDSGYARLSEMLLDDSPVIRRRGWSIVSCLNK